MLNLCSGRGWGHSGAFISTRLLGINSSVSDEVIGSAASISVNRFCRGFDDVLSLDLRAALISVP